MRGLAVTGGEVPLDVTWPGDRSGNCSLRKAWPFLLLMWMGRQGPPTPRCYWPRLLVGAQACPTLGSGKVLSSSGTGGRYWSIFTLGLA